MAFSFSLKEIDYFISLSLEMGWWRKKNREEADAKQKLVQANGEVVLEKLIEYCNGKSNPIKTFSASQILRATDNFSSPVTLLFSTLVVVTDVTEVCLKTDPCLSRNG